MKDFCIVGSGIAGSTIANLLAKKILCSRSLIKQEDQVEEHLIRRYKGKLSFDHGLQYFSPKS